MPNALGGASPQQPVQRNGTGSRRNGPQGLARAEPRERVPIHRAGGALRDQLSSSRYAQINANQKADLGAGYQVEETYGKRRTRSFKQRGLNSCRNRKDRLSQWTIASVARHQPSLTGKALLVISGLRPLRRHRDQRQPNGPTIRRRCRRRHCKGRGGNCFLADIVSPGQ